VIAFGMSGSEWTSPETVTGFTAAGLPQRELKGLPEGNATFGRPTQTGPDVLDLS